MFSFFILDFYRVDQIRPLGFSRSDFNFDHTYGDYGPEFAIVDLINPERMTAYSTALIRKMASDAGLSLVMDPVPGLWSGTQKAPVGSQDIVVLERTSA